MSEKEYQYNRLLIGGLIAFSLILVQAFITTGLTDIASYISVIAFAIAIPSLAVFVWCYNDVVTSARLALPPRVLLLFLGSIFVDIIGVAAAFWHISWIAGLLLLVSGVVALIVYFDHRYDLYEDNKNPLSKLE